MKIGIDLDGVLVDTYKYVIDYYNQKYDSNFSLSDFPETTKVAQYLSNRYLFNQDMSEKIWKGDMPHVFSNASSINTSIECIQDLTSNDIVEVFYVSARPNLVGVEAITSKWLTDNKLPFSNNLIINQTSKVKTAHELKLNYFIEDAPFHISTLAGSGIDVLVLDTPYNTSVNVENSTRFNSWEDILKFLSVRTLKQEILI
ncbi:5' nucleotidase, NT5C type [Alkalihalobacterium sp. APHAB7]|uniref:5' nucleotidase, NT5C type n=1 Tax=Alkalihalobacterium sp. APHAB7 TaxID=3402081 RepID=UPI003AADF521